MERISSRENAKIKYAVRLREEERFRRTEGLFFAEGPKLCLELAKDCALHVMYATQTALDRTPQLASFSEKTILVEASVAEKLSGTKSSQGVFGLFCLPRSDLQTVLERSKRLLALEGVQDPGNVGTLLRSAAAFGFDAVVLGAGCAAPFSEKTLRASMGAAGRLPVVQTPDLPASLRALRERGVKCLAAALYNSCALDEAQCQGDSGVCVVIGSEGQGLTDATIAACDQAVRIPMTDLVESLNAGVAGSVLLWHFRNLP